MKRALVGVCLIILPVAAASAIRRSPPSIAGQTYEVVSQPANWIPFSADLVRVHASSGRTYVGRFYRSADGSTRSETGRPGLPVDTIGIKNISERKLYLWSRGLDRWTAQPMLLPSEEWRPTPRRKKSGIDIGLEPIAGFQVMRSRKGVRDIFEAPYLNLFPLVVIEPCTGSVGPACGIWHTNVVVGEQPSQYFRTPEGAYIEELDEPGGIISREPSSKP